MIHAPVTLNCEQSLTYKPKIILFLEGSSIVMAILNVSKVKGLNITYWAELRHFFRTIFEETYKMHDAVKLRLLKLGEFKPHQWLVQDLISFDPFLWSFTID